MATLQVLFTKRSSVRLLREAMLTEFNYFCFVVIIRAEHFEHSALLLSLKMIFCLVVKAEKNIFV